MINGLKEALAEGTVLTTTQVYDIIRKYLEGQFDYSQREMLDKDGFDSPAWSERQAYLLGNMKAIQKLLDFIPNLDQRK